MWWESGRKGMNKARKQVMGELKSRSRSKTITCYPKFQPVKVGNEEQNLRTQSKIFKQTCVLDILGKDEI
jgi:hypothetical protein